MQTLLLQEKKLEIWPFLLKNMHISKSLISE